MVNVEVKGVPAWSDPVAVRVCVPATEDEMEIEITSSVDSLVGVDESTAPTPVEASLKSNEFGLVK